jgi:hypothetical protein
MLKVNLTKKQLLKKQRQAKKSENTRITTTNDTNNTKDDTNDNKKNNNNNKKKNNNKNVKMTVLRTMKMKPPSKRNPKILHYTTCNLTNQPQPHLPPLISRANSNLPHHTTEKLNAQPEHDPTTFNNLRHSQQHKYATLSSRSVLLCPALLLP